MSQTTATLWAACIAAVAALLTLASNLLGARRAEMRAAQRSHLNPLLADLGEGTHACIACANILRKRALRGQDQGGWIARGAAGASQIKAVRPKLRYVLYGLDEPLRTLSRIPEWVATYKDVPETNVDQLLNVAGKLKEEIDQVVQRSYVRGLPPTRWQRWRLKRQAELVRSLWENRFDGVARPR